MGIVKIILLVLGVLIGLIVLELLFVAVTAFIPTFKVLKQVLNATGSESTRAGPKKPVSKEEVSYQIKETSISAWLYRPESKSEPAPCIVMGHGFGEPRTCFWKITPFASRKQVMRC